MFKRGFKAWCDQTAEATRKQRRLATWEPLGARLLAAELRCTLITPSDLPALDRDIADRLVSRHSDIWSAITIADDPPVIVFNPAHSPARQNSDLMHEIAHLLMEHKPGTVYIDPRTQMALRHYDPDQEEQANWLAACLLLPRAALLRIKNYGMDEADACHLYNVSLKMLRFRMNASGVNVQYSRRRTFGPAAQSADRA